MRRNWLRDNGLTLALMALFLVSIVGHALTGWQAYNEEQRQHAGQAIDLIPYLGTGHFMSSVFENWESEFLQMSAYVILTAYLFQRGSPESNDPDISPSALKGLTTRERNATMARFGGNRALVWLYSKSLGLALAGLFVASFVLHLIGSARMHAEEAIQHGQPPPTVVEHLASAEFWFESFQNWQSEFLSTAALIVLAIFLRQQNSPESKKLTDPTWKTGSG